MSGFDEELSESDLFDERLIFEVHKYPLLYDHGDEFKDAEKKENTWKMISEELDAESGTVCENRWISLKAMFSRERAKQKQPSGDKARTRKVWPLYEEMKWLGDFMTTRKRKSNVSQRDLSMTYVPISSNDIESLATDSQASGDEDAFSTGMSTCTLSKMPFDEMNCPLRPDFCLIFRLYNAWCIAP